MSDCAVVRDEVPTARRAFDPCNDITDAREASALLRRDELGHGNSRPSRASQCPMTRLYEIDGAFLCARGQRFYSCPCRLMRFEPMAEPVCQQHGGLIAHCLHPPPVPRNRLADARKT